MKNWTSFKKDKFSGSRNCGAEINLIDRRVLGTGSMDRKIDDDEYDDNNDNNNNVDVF